MAVADLRIAICRRCREPSRRAAGADTAEALLDAARASVTADAPKHLRLSQCLNCCDGGHTVRVELHGTEVALVGIRTRDELARVLENAEAIGRREVPPDLERRVYQVWVDGALVFHRGV